MTDALANGRIQYDKKSGGIFENSQMAGWDGVERYAMPATPMPEWYYPQDETGGPYSGLASDPAKLRRVMQKNPSDVIFVRVEHPAVAEPAQPVAQPEQKVIYQKAVAPNAVAATAQPQVNAVAVMPAGQPNAVPYNQQANAVVVTASPPQANAVVAAPQQPEQYYNAYAPAAGAVPYQPVAPSAARTDVSQTATTITINPPLPAPPKPQPQQQAQGGVAGYWNSNQQPPLATQSGQPYMVFSNEYR
jgi:hypothetical protein